MTWQKSDTGGAPNTSKVLNQLAGLFALLTTIVFPAAGATLTMQTNVLGPTPTIVGYNHGHYYPNSNTRDWWRYSGVTGDRVFISPGYCEPGSATSPWGSGVTDQTSFSSRVATVRANPTNNPYFNWSYFVGRYATPGLIGSDRIEPALVCSEMQQLGIQTLVVSSASASTFTNMSSWGDKWELWLFYYEQAFYLGGQFNVQRYQMYNEPNDGGPSASDFLIRLQVASDAIVAGIADANTVYGKSLTAEVCAPVTAGSATSSFSGYGGLVVTNRHVNYQGQTNANFDVIQDYDYHQYGSGGSPSSFGTGLATLESEMSAAMSPETRFPISISEFNVYDGSQFNGLPSSEDTPSNYTAFGAIATSLIQNGISGLYCFKLSQTIGSGYPAKNGMLFVDNTNAPYNIGGITKGGEVWRLMNKGVALGRAMLQFQADAGASGLNVIATHDAAAGRYYLLSVNNTTSSVNLTANFSAWNIPTNEQIFVEEVSETNYGAIAQGTRIGASRSAPMTQGANTVWLYTVPSTPQQAAGPFLATDCAQVTDGTNRTVNYGATNAVVAVENNSTNASLRSATFMKFQIPAINPTNIQFAMLSMVANSMNGGSNVEAFVYGITNNNWSASSVTWSVAPNLAQNVAAGVGYVNNYVMGIGDMTGGIAGANSAQLQGQLVAGPSVFPGKALDVTSFVKSATGTNVSFLLARLNHFYGDTQDGDGISISSSTGNATNGPRLNLVLYPQPVVISNLSVVARPNSAIITWATSSNATTQVFYGTTSAYGSMTTLNTNLTTNHAVLLTGLTSNTNYYFEAVSTAGSNSATASGSFSTSNSLILTSDEATYAGVWTIGSSAPDKFSPLYEFASTVNGADTADALFRPNIVAAGLYDVYFWFSEGTNRSQAAPVTVGYQGASNESLVNEATNGGSWQLLVSGEPFSAGTNGYLRLGNGSGETGRVVIADAAQWVYTADQDSASNGVVPAWWANFYFGTNTVNSAALGSNGYTLLTDYVMGLSPVDASAVLSLNMAAVSNGLQAVFSPWEGGRVYGLQSATTILNPSWTTVANASGTQNTNGQGVLTITNVSGGAEMFYRLSVRMSP